MAKRGTRAQGRSKGKPEPKRAPKKVVRTEVEVVEDQSGTGWETGVAILTGVLLLIAILIVDYNLGQNDAGLIF